MYSPKLSIWTTPNLTDNIWLIRVREPQGKLFSPHLSTLNNSCILSLNYCVIIAFSRHMFISLIAALSLRVIIVTFNSLARIPFTRKIQLTTHKHFAYSISQNWNPLLMHFVFRCISLSLYMKRSSTIWHLWTCTPLPNGREMLSTTLFQSTHLSGKCLTIDVLELFEGAGPGASCPRCRIHYPLLNWCRQGPHQPPHRKASPTSTTERLPNASAKSSPPSTNDCHKQSSASATN